MRRARPHYGGLDRLTFKHQGFNPTGSFKDNGMTCGVTQAIRLGRKRVACVSTGNTSASMAAYASAAGLDSIVFIPHGNISYGKLAQALEYGARTLQVEANFDQILALVRVLAERARHVPAELHQSISHRRAEEHHFRNAGSARLESTGLDRVAGRQSRQHFGFRKSSARIARFGFIAKMPRLAVIQAEGAAPFYDFIRNRRRVSKRAAIRTRWPPRLRSAIRYRGPRRCSELTESNGVVEKVSEQEIADAKAIIGRCGIGCEPASAATLAGIRKLTEARRDSLGRGCSCSINGKCFERIPIIFINITPAN